MKPPKRDHSLVIDYKQEHPYCELLGYLEGEKWQKKLKEYKAFFNIKHPEHWPTETLQLHHIFQGKDKWDIWPNMIHLSVAAHTYAHENPAHTKVACLYAKFMKGDLRAESLELMRSCFGFCPIGKMSCWDITAKWALNMKSELEKGLLNQ